MAFFFFSAVYHYIWVLTLARAENESSVLLGVSFSVQFYDNFTFNCAAPWRKNNPFCPNVCWFHQFSQEIIPGLCYSHRSLLEPCVFSCQCLLVYFSHPQLSGEGLGDESFPPSSYLLSQTPLCGLISPPQVSPRGVA